MKSFKKPEINCFNGRCLVVLRPTGKAGEIKLKAESDGLSEAEIVITQTKY